MKSGDGKDGGRPEWQSNDSLRSPDGQARSGFFGRYSFSGVVQNIVNKFSGIVPKTLSPPPMTATSPTRNEATGRDRSIEQRDRSDTPTLSLYQMKLWGMSSDAGPKNDQSNVVVGGRQESPVQIRTESSSVIKSTSNVAIQSPFISPHSGPVGQMPAVHLSPRQRPPSLRNEDHTKKSVTVKIAQLDPLSTSLMRYPLVETLNENNSSSIDASVLTETVVEALKKRKRSRLDADENEARDLEGNDVQTSKRRCSRDDVVSAPETVISRGMKRPALHDTFANADETTDQSPGVAEAAAKKICQNASPPTRHTGCGARNVITASYSSHLRWEERLMRAKSLSRAASSQDESMPLVDDGRPASSQTSRCSSHLSHLSRANSPAPHSEDLRSRHSVRSSALSTPLNLLPRLHDVDSVQRAPLLVRDGSVKNRVTMLSTVSSSPSVTPSIDLETQLTQPKEIKASVEFTADDLERDRDLLNSRASRLLLGFLDAEDDKTESVVEPSSSVPLPGTSAFVLGTPSTAFQASASTPPSSVSTTITAASTDNQIQTDFNSRLTGADLFKSKVDDGATRSDSSLHSSSVLTSKQQQVGPSAATNTSFNFGSAPISATSTDAVSCTAPLPATQDSSGSKSLAPFESSLKGFGAGAVLTPATGTFDVSKVSSANSLNGFFSSALTTAAGSTTASVTSAFGTASNAQATTVSFGNSSNSAVKAAESVGAFPALGDTRISSGFFGNMAGGGLSAVGNSAIAATSATTAIAATSATTATKDNTQLTVGGFPFHTQTNANNLSSAKPLVVTAQSTSGGLSFETLSTTQPITNSFSFGNAGPARTSANSFGFGHSGSTQTNSGSFSFPNSGASQTTASSFGFGNSGNAQTTASSSAFGNMGATQTTASSLLFGNTGPSQTPASSFTFGNSATQQTTASSFAVGTQATASSFSFANAGNAQTSDNSLIFGNSGNTQTTASSLSFGNLGATQSSAGGFSFGTNLTTGNTSGGAATNMGGFPFGNSSSKQMMGGGFGNSGNAQTTANSSFTSLAATPQFSFSKSSAPTTAAGGFAFGNVQQSQASADNLTTANPFGSSISSANVLGSNSTIPNTFSSNAATGNTFGSNTGPANTFGSSGAIANSFGSNAKNAFGGNVATANTFGTGTTTITFGNNVTTANTFSSNAATANTFGSTQLPSNPFNISAATTNPFGGNVATANPFGTPNNNFDSKSSAAGLQFSRPDVAAQSTPQDLRRVLFPSSTPANNANPASNLNAMPSQQQQQTAFSFFGSKTDGNSNSSNSSGGFTFGKNSLPAPTFGSNSTAGGFAFGKTAGSNPPNQGFTFQGAPQSGTSSQVPNTGFGFSGQPNSQTQNAGFNFQAASQPTTNPPNAGFNFNASTSNFSFGQMPNPPVNGLPSMASFTAGPKFTPGLSSSSSSTRSLRQKKKTR